MTKGKNNQSFQLPPIGKQSKPDSKASKIQSLVAKDENKKNEGDEKKHWLFLLDLEHADAIISDAFWYVICKILNP